MTHLFDTARRSAALAALTIAALAAVPASSATVFSTTLSSLNQVPPVVSSASGTGSLTFAPDYNSFTVLINFTNLSSAIVGAHVHCCNTANGNAPIAVDFMLPTNVTTAGTITGLYNLTLASTYTPDFLAAGGGTAVGARNLFLSGVGNGLAYLNVHSAAFPDGEIRGQLAPGSSVGGVPEPASWALMITGFALVGGTMRRRAARTIAA